MFIQKVKKDKRDEYIEVHKNAWPELLKAIKESGIEREIIWIDEQNNLYLYFMSENFDDAFKKLAKTQVFKDWIVKMSDLLEIMQDYSDDGKIKKLPKIFDVEQQLRQLED